MYRERKIGTLFQLGKSKYSWLLVWQFGQQNINYRIIIFCVIFLWAEFFPPFFVFNYIKHKKHSPICSWFYFYIFVGFHHIICRTMKQSRIFEINKLVFYILFKWGVALFLLLFTQLLFAWVNKSLFTVQSDEIFRIPIFFFFLQTN